MPINHRVSGNASPPEPSEFKPHSRTKMKMKMKMKMKCPTDPAARKRIPGCAPIELKPNGSHSVPGPSPSPSPSPSPGPSPSPSPNPNPNPNPTPTPGPSSGKSSSSPPSVLPYRGAKESLLKKVENLTAEEYDEAKLVKRAYEWREYYDKSLNLIEKHERDGPGLDYDDPESLSNAKREAKKRATERLTDEMSDSPYYVDLEHTNPDTGGITFVNKNSNVAYLTLHGKEAGVQSHFPEGPLNRSAAEINALDDRSVKRSAFSNPFSNKDHIPELYPDLDSQADSLLNDFGEQRVKVISYSNGGSKHLYLNRTKGMAGTSFDPFLGPRQARDIARGTKAPFKLITTDNLSVADIGIGLAPGIGRNVDIKYVPHEEGVNTVLPRINEYVMQNHSLEGPFSEDTNLAAPNRGAVMSTVKDQAKGMATAMASDFVVDKIDPNATGQTKLLETAATNVAFDSAAAGSLALLTGAPVAAAASTVAAETLVPTVVAYEAGEAVYHAMDKPTSNMDNRPAAGAIKGGLAGAAAVTSATATGKVIATGVNAVKSVSQTAAAGESGIEMSLVGAEANTFVAAESVTALDAGIEMGAVGAEVGGLAATEAGLLTATEVTGAAAAAEGGLNPIADIAFVGSAVATGLATGAGAMFGAVNESNKKKQAEQLKQDKNEDYINQLMMQADVNARVKKEQNKLNKLGQFINDTPDIGKDIETRLDYLYSHKKPYLSDSHFKEISDPQNYKIAPRNWRIEQEQIRYIHNHLNIYKDYLKTVDGFPADTLSLHLDKERLGVTPGYQNMPNDTFWLDKQRLGVTVESDTSKSNTFESDAVEAA